MNRSLKLYGQGIRFPLVPEPGLGFITGSDAVAQAIRSVLLTQPGERIQRPVYGAGRVNIELWFLENAFVAASGCVQCGLMEIAMMYDQ